MLLYAVLEYESGNSSSSVSFSVSEKKVTVHEIPEPEEHLPEKQIKNQEEIPMQKVTEPAPSETGFESDMPEKQGEAEIFFPPTVIGDMKPVYPQAAVSKGLEGDVVIQLYVDERGNLIRTEIKHSSGHRLLDRAAVREAEKCSFRPGRRNGIAVGGSMTVEIQFRLGD